MAYKEVNGDPKALLESTRECVEYHADLMDAYGYHQPTATLGSHPWLRDSLANPNDMEPGDAEPKIGLKEPFENE